MDNSFLIFSLLFGFFGGVFSTLLISSWTKKTLPSFYEEQVKKLVSPHHLRKEFSKKVRDFVLVDLRSKEEYEKSHIIESLNIPAYKDPFTSDYDDVERIVTGFKTLQEKYPQKNIVLYCYSKACMTGKKIGLLLERHKIPVKCLGIGWNEWRYHWETWNHEHEWDSTKVEDYVFSGKEPGVYLGKSRSTACLIENDLAC